MNNPIVFSFSINDIFQWIGYIVCGGLCVFTIFNPLILYAISESFSGWSYERKMRRRLKRQQRNQFTDEEM